MPTESVAFTKVWNSQSVDSSYRINRERARELTQRVERETYWERDGINREKFSSPPPPSSWSWPHFCAPAINGEWLVQCPWNLLGEMISTRTTVRCTHAHPDGTQHTRMLTRPANKTHTKKTHYCCKDCWDFPNRHTRSITETTHWNLRRGFPNTVGRIVEMTTQTGIHVVNYRNQLLEWTYAELKLG